MMSKRKTQLDGLAVLSIPWMSRAKVVAAMQQLCRREQFDSELWSRLVKRAVVIAHSFTAKDVARIVSSMSAAREVDQAFMRRLLRRFSDTQVLAGANPHDMAALAHGAAKLGTELPQDVKLRTLEVLPRADTQQVCLIAGASASLRVDGFAECLEAQIERVLVDLQPMQISVLLHAVASFEGMSVSSSTSKVVQMLVDRLPERVQAMDSHSLCLVLSSLGRLGVVQKDVQDLAMGELLPQLTSMDGHSVAMCTNAISRLPAVRPDFLESVLHALRSKVRTLDGPSICIVANALARMEIRDVDLFHGLYDVLPRSIGKLSAKQLAMLAHAWAKAHIHNEDLYLILAPLVVRNAEQFGPREVAMATYGFAHFRLDVPDVYAVLRTRAEVLLDDQRFSRQDLLMFANALSKAQIRDSVVEVALAREVLGTQAQEHLSSRTKSLYGLTI
mmetsp:Transcript_59063/g.129372  ORF Transcript_59063/g.129372 Transcript_59063/m.129372 type:complete len:446 (+) Transcript_59063:27-1364(+)